MSFKALGDKIIATMHDGFGEKKSTGGIIIQEKDGDTKSIRPRWFKVTHVGPEQESVSVGEYVYVEHGRWTRGFKIDKTTNTKYYMLDNAKILAATTDDPVNL
jgi:co-chaperonin GroES (HSP10)